MKRAVSIMSMISAVVLLVAAQSFEQGGSKGRRNSWGPGSSYNRLYNHSTVETISGEVVSVDKIIPMRGMSSGIHLVLKSDAGAISVHVGPAWYLDNQDTKISVGDKIEVVGSRITFQDKPAIIASEIIKDGRTLKLRDSVGYPLWSGWRNR